MWEGTHLGQLCCMVVQVYTAASVTPTPSVLTTKAAASKIFAVTVTKDIFTDKTTPLYTLDKGDGSAISACAELGAAAASADLKATLTDSVTYATSGTKYVSIAIYAAADCSKGSAPAGDKKPTVVATTSVVVR